MWRRVNVTRSADESDERRVHGHTYSSPTNAYNWRAHSMYIQQAYAHAASTCTSASTSTCNQHMHMHIPWRILLHSPSPLSSCTHVSICVHSCFVTSTTRAITAGVTTPVSISVCISCVCCCCFCSCGCSCASVSVSISVSVSSGSALRGAANNGRVVSM